MIKPKNKSFDELEKFSDMQYENIEEVFEEDFALENSFDDDDICVTFGRGEIAEIIEDEEIMLNDFKEFDDDNWNEFEDSAEDGDWSDDISLEQALAMSDEVMDFETEHCTEELLANLRREVEDFFKEDGVLTQKSTEISGRQGEYRPQQSAMALKIVEAIGKGENLCVEAPTGVGKSFAYLIPLIYRAKFAKFPAVISTETINLQEQLIEKDIPFLQKILGLDFKAVIAKGRSNYLCLRRLAMLNGDLRDSLLPNPSMVLELEKINDCHDSAGGERSNFNCRISNEIWSLIASETINCQGVKCPFYRRCYYFGVRKLWDSADIIVTNHALFFTDLRLKSEDDDASLLPKFGMAVIDEAHTLEENAAEHLGLYLSKGSMIGTMNKLYNPENAKGLLLKEGKNALELRRKTVELRDEIYGFFHQFESYLTKLNTTNARIKNTGPFVDTISGLLLDYSRALSQYSSEITDASFRTEIEGYQAIVNGFIDGVAEFPQMTRSNSVYYIESEKNNLILRRSPLDIAELLREMLFDTVYPVILSSATLTIRGKFDYFANRIGFTNGDKLILDSPFDHSKVKLFVPKNMVEATHADYQKILVAYIKEFLRQTHGKAFVLFTSYSLLRQVADAMREFFVEEGIQLLVQGENMSRSLMLKEFKSDVDSVIFGTDSFWTGVDVPGESLSNVIITKLPFAVPTNPLVAARCEEIKNRGGNEFFEYSVPDAVLKFRQGIGRLIRSRDDSGIIVILDKRIISKGYGREFSESIPYPMNIF
ncbi:MAG: DEAD/DEAH box helicase [Lentisphaeria bacterium]|nr:DEAD/DEAH box helicase [Lentisphaeria bacterium]